MGMHTHARHTDVYTCMHTQEHVHANMHTHTHRPVQAPLLAPTLGIQGWCRGAGVLHPPLTAHWLWRQRPATATHSGTGSGHRPHAGRPGLLPGHPAQHPTGSGGGRSPCSLWPLRWQGAPSAWFWELAPRTLGEAVRAQCEGCGGGWEPSTAGR